MSDFRACLHLLGHCAQLKASERLLIVSDQKTKILGEMLLQEAKGITPQVKHCVIETLSMHGQEPPGEIAAQMMQADVICGITSKSMAHTQARFKATQRGARYLSLPDYSLDVFNDPSLEVNFHELTGTCDHITDLFTKGSTVRIQTPAGTSLSCAIDGRIGNSAPGWLRAPGTLASPPDAESNIALVENKSEGVLVVDGSIPYDGLGALKSPVVFDVKDGKVTDLHAQGVAGDILKELLFSPIDHQQRRVLAELGIGLNPKAKLRGIMLIDEGALGTFHIGLGSNTTIGGQNKVDFHLDLVMHKPTMSIDDQIILDQGMVVCAHK